MHTISPAFDPSVVFAKTITIDAAIVEAKKHARGQAVLVRDGKNIRIVARDGRAFWAEPCKPCKGIGSHMPVTGTWGGVITTCEYCDGVGVTEGLQCQ